MVSTEDAQQLATEYDWPYVETSAKTGDGIEEAFLHLLHLVMKRIIRMEIQENKNRKLRSDAVVEKSRCGC